MLLLFNKIYRFYRYECCWPYSLSFVLVLVIYWLDFIVERNAVPLASYLSYTVIFSYYIYNLYRYAKGKMNPKVDIFFIKFLSAKISILGLLLLYLSSRVRHA
jgi:hypothetical protein